MTTHVNYVYGPNGAQNLTMAAMGMMEAIQQVSNLLLSLNVAVEQTQEGWAQWFSNSIGGASMGHDLPKHDPNWINKNLLTDPTLVAKLSIVQLTTWADGQNSKNGTQSTDLQWVAGISAARNTNNNQVQSFFSNINNGINQTSSNTEQVLQVDQSVIQSLNQLLQAPFGG